MIIIQKNFNTPISYMPPATNSASSFLTPQFLVTNPTTTGVVAAPAVGQAVTARPVISTSDFVNSSVSPDILETLSNRHDPAVRLRLQMNNTTRALNQTAAQPVIDQALNPTHEQVLATVGQGIDQPGVGYNPQVTTNVPEIQTTTEVLPDGTTTINVAGADINADSAAGALPKLSLREQLANKGEVLKNNASNLVDRLKAGEGYGSGITGSLGTDAAVLAGGLALAGGAYHLLKKRRAKKRAEKGI